MKDSSFTSFCNGWFMRGLAGAWVILTLPFGVLGQTAILTGQQMTLLSTSNLFPQSIALNAAGDVFIGDTAGNQVLKVPAAGGAPVVALSNVFATGLAFDAAGNLFVVDRLGRRVLELPAGGRSAVSVGTGWVDPVGVAVDASGNVFVSDTSFASVIKIAAGSGVESFAGSGLYRPEGLAVDRSGNLFIADAFNQRVVEVPAGNGAQMTVASGLTTPTGIAVDPFGNVFISDFGAGQLFEVPLTSTGFGLPAPVPTGVADPLGVAVDANGALYIGDTDGHRMVKVPEQTGNFGSINVCPTGQTTPRPCSQTYTLMFQITAPSTPIAGDALTMGAENLDFTYNAATSTCTNNGTASETCSLSVTFAPKYPGLRRGAVRILNDTNGKALTTALVYGRGVGPQVGYSPIAQSVVSALSGQHFTAVAVDGSDNLFVADSLSDRLLEIHADGSPQSTLGEGFSGVGGLAVDGAGNVLVSDSGNQRIVRVSPKSTEFTTLVTNRQELAGLAVDGTGNIIFSASEIGEIFELATDGTSTMLPILGPMEATGFAVDEKGTLYIADPGNEVFPEVNGAIEKTTLGSSGAIGATYLAHDIRPGGVAVDGAGDVFYTDMAQDTGLGQVVEIPADGSADIVLYNGQTIPQGIAIDSTGDLFFTVGSGVVELKRSSPPALTFAATTIGSISSNSPQTTTVQNIGNSPLTFATPKTGSNPSYPSPFPEATGTISSIPLCASGTPMAIGASCILSVNFEPTVTGANVGSVVLTDNVLNATNVVQKIAVIGQGLLMTPEVTWETPAPIRAGTALSGLQLDATSGVPGKCVYSPAAAVVLAAGSHTLSCVFTPTDSTKYAKTTVTVDLFIETVIKVKPAITWPAPAPISYGIALSTAQLHATSTVAGEFAYTSSGAAITAGMVLGAGTHTLTVTFTPTDTIDYTIAAASVALVVNPAKLTVTVTSTSMIYGKALPALTRTVTGFVHGDTASALSGVPVETTKATSTSSVGSYPITVTQGTLKAANYSFVFINGTLTIIPIGVAATPVFSVVAGTYTAAQIVTLTDSTSGTLIYYTNNGTVPTTNSAKYTVPFTVAKSETIKAIAVATGYADSAVASVGYVIEAPAATPVFSTVAGTYTVPQSVKITSSTTGATIYYTNNGTVPTTNSAKYRVPFTVAKSETIKAIAVATGYANSAASVGYVIEAPVASPVMSPVAGTYTSPQLVTISSAKGTTIYYTTNGTTPTRASTKYTAGINVSTTETIKALAVLPGNTNSPLASAA